jgi:hypothetical protein
MTLLIVTTSDQDDIFAKHFLRHGDAVQACVQARIVAPGYDIRDVAAYNLDREETKEALSRLKGKSSVPTDLSRNSIVTDLEEIAQRALDAGEFAPAITAKKTQAQLLGYLDQNVTLTVKSEVSNYSTSQLEQMLQERMNKAKVIDGEFTEKQPVGLGQITHTARP